MTNLEVFEQHANQMRFVLDLVCRAMDERNDEGTRIQAAYDIIESGHLYSTMGRVREKFRNIANKQTDMGGV